MTEGTRVKFACPDCGSEPEKHGAGGKAKCKDKFTTGGGCQGFICECDEGYENKNHGETFKSACMNANCYHCGWAGEFPKKPKGLQPWEKKALEAGWTMPAARKKELGLG